MAKPRAIRGALRSFLGTFTSRYSQFNRYWLFGFVLKHGDRFDIDLMSSDLEPADPKPVAAARALARLRFREQMAKNRVKESVVAASLSIEVAPEGVAVVPHWRNAKPVRFTVEARSKGGESISASSIVQVAPHNPFFEMQSAVAVGN